MSCCFSTGTFQGQPLLFWRVLCLFGTVLVVLPVGFPLGAFLLIDGHAADLVTERGAMGGVEQEEHSAPVVMPGSDGGGGVIWISGPGGGVKRVRLNRKTPAHLVRHGIFGIQSRPRVWKRLTVLDHSVSC